VDLDGIPHNSESQTDIPQPFMFLIQDFSEDCGSNCEAAGFANHQLLFFSLL
jgi:hypothetical protein